MTMTDNPPPSERPNLRCDKCGKPAVYVCWFPWVSTPMECALLCTRHTVGDGYGLPLDRIYETDVHWPGGASLRVHVGEKRGNGLALFEQREKSA